MLQGARPTASEIATFVFVPKAEHPVSSLRTFDVELLQIESLAGSTRRPRVSGGCARAQCAASSFRYSRTRSSGVTNPSIRSQGLPGAARISVTAL